MSLRMALEGKTPAQGLSAMFMIALFVVSTGYMCQRCYTSSAGPPELNQAYRVMHQMMGEENLKQTGFYENYPDGTPSDFVEFIVTDDAEPLWPRTTREASLQRTDPTIQGGPSGQQLMPNDVDLVALEPDPTKMRQLVYIPDDVETKIILEGYDNPNDEPVHTWTVDFPTNARTLDL